MRMWGKPKRISQKKTPNKLMTNNLTLSASRDDINFIKKTHTIF